MSYLHLIHENNKLTLNRPADTNRVYYSQLMEWFTNNAFRSFSIKYVVKGAIYYRAGMKEYKVGEDQFLLTSKQPNAKAYFDSKEPVKSICIDICPWSIAEAFTVLRARNDHDLDNYMAGYFEHPNFFERVYPADNSVFGKQLKNLARQLSRGYFDNDMIDEEWFLQLVEHIILQEKDTQASLQNLTAKKNATRKEIYERVLMGKEFIDENFLQNPEISAVAYQCNLSVYHFFRSFKEAFDISPYQYMMRLRLQHALQLMQNENFSLTAIAAICSFPDVFTFSKAFKRTYGVSPAKYPGLHE